MPSPQKNCPFVGVKYLDNQNDVPSTESVPSEYNGLRIAAVPVDSSKAFSAISTRKPQAIKKTQGRFVGVLDRIRDRQDVALVKRPPPHDNVLVFRTEFPYHALPASGTYVTFTQASTKGKKLKKKLKFQKNEFRIDFSKFCSLRSQSFSSLGFRYALAVDVAIAPRGYGLSCLYEVDPASSSESGSETDDHSM